MQRLIGDALLNAMPYWAELELTRAARLQP